MKRKRPTTLAELRKAPKFLKMYTDELQDEYTRMVAENKSLKASLEIATEALRMNFELIDGEAHFRIGHGGRMALRPKHERAIRKALFLPKAPHCSKEEGGTP